MTIYYGVPLLVKVFLWSLVYLPIDLASSVKRTGTTFAKLAFVLGWDSYLFVFNFLTPDLKKGTVYKKGAPGYGGLWPEFVAPTEQDSRSPCPGLNAMANHGIIPHSGSGIKLSELKNLINVTYNFAPTMCIATVAQVEKFLGRDTIDLSDLNIHNMIAHDASLLRQDDYFQSDQSTPAKELITKFLTTASGGRSAEHPEGFLTPADISRWLSVRKAQSKRDNPHYTLSDDVAAFGLTNSSIILDIYGGDVKACQTLLIEEKLPQGWETSNRTRKGLTIIDLKLRALELSLGLKEMTL